MDKAWYVIATTYESNAVFKKLRVVIASESLLKEISEMPPSWVPELEDEVHSRRWQTLQKMSKRFTTVGCNNPESGLWRIEMAFPKSNGVIAQTTANN